MTTRKPSPDRMQAAPPKRLKLSSGSSRVLRLEGPVGHESLVEAVYPDGTSVAYEGHKGHERMVAAAWPNGDKAHYSGEGDAERLTHVDCTSKKKIDYYEGSHGREALRRTEWPETGRVRYWGGDSCCEHMIRTTYRGGGMKMYSGPKREEHMIAFQNADDSFTHYDGPKGEERAWLKVTSRNGTAQVMSPASGRITHSILMDGKVLFHSRNGERVTHAPPAKYQKIKNELNATLAKLSELNEKGLCKEEALRSIGDCLCSINAAAEECFIAHDGDKYELGTSSQMNEAESEDEDEDLGYLEMGDGKSDADDSDIE